MKLVNAKRLISTLGAAVLRVTVAKRLGNRRVGQEVNKMGREKGKLKLEQGRKRDNRDWVTDLQAELQGRQMGTALL